MTMIIKAGQLKKLRSLVRFQEKKIKRLESLAERDFLTGIYNQRGFINQVEKFLKEFKSCIDIKFKQKQRKSFIIKSFSLIFIDLDDIKIINDILGHRAGDKTIKEVANFFQNSLRKTDILARWGGDEFVAFLLGASEKQAFKVTEKIRQGLMNLKVNFQNKKIRVTASFGIVSDLTEQYKHYNRGKIKPRLYQLIEQANKAMYKAKKNLGKNAVVTIKSF